MMVVDGVMWLLLEGGNGAGATGHQGRSGEVWTQRIIAPDVLLPRTVPSKLADGGK